MNSKANSAPLYVAGIGASAGGLEALNQLLAGLVPTGETSYIIVQHMAHDAHSALMVNLLNRQSMLPVTLARSGSELLADRIYLVPAGVDATFSGNRIILIEPVSGSFSTPSINALFNSLAATFGKQSMGLILSGTGTDGRAGIIAIRAAGGRTFAQSPEDATYRGMPVAAIESGCVDVIAGASDLAARIQEYVTPNAIGAKDDTAKMCSAGKDCQVNIEEEEVSALVKLIRNIKTLTGVNFGAYKEETLLRRLRRRLLELNLVDVADYLRFAEQEPEELFRLQHIFLVSLSSFFRDNEAFHVLRKSLKDYFGLHHDHVHFNAWVPACATGEEVYSIAILLKELSVECNCLVDISLTGTDLNEEALAVAQKGEYPIRACEAIDSEILEKYFLRKTTYFSLTGTIRQLCSFSGDDILSDDRHENLDLISCRNFLIYLKSEEQGQLIEKFHRKLKRGGLLFLGQAETLGLMGAKYFEPIDSNNKVYRRR